MSLTHIPQNINLSGEYLLNCSLRFCQTIMRGANIENTYGAVEFGEIAHQSKTDRHVFEVFNQFCYLENKEDKIVVTSLVNETFPIIRYVMEDIGTVVNRDGKQYIHNLVGKNTNQIKINGNTLSSIDIDKMIDVVNIDQKIISIVVRYDQSSIDIHYIVLDLDLDLDLEIYPRDQIITKTKQIIQNKFDSIICNVLFLEKYDHDYLKKFKIIMKKDNSDSEPVGGFFKTKQ